MGEREEGSSYCLERVCLFSQVLHGESSSTTESTRRMNIEINAKVMEVVVCVFLVPVMTVVYSLLSPVQLEQLGAMGRVEEAQMVMRELEELEREREKLSVATNNPRVSSTSGL